jgi:ABC-type bacteriocin/lantibiotic exporter with double-glycine peptidase domain
VRDQFKLISSAVNDDQIKQELSRCGLDVAQLPLGLETIVGGSGEGTSAASGGQIRKIAVARALFSHPRILIADEPTADLDTESGKKVMVALREYAIVICITHDLSIVRSEDSQQHFFATVSS